MTTRANVGIGQAMQRYFVHIIENGHRFTDEDGFLTSGLAGARQMAMDGAREIMAAEILTGSLCLSTSMEISDQTGSVVDHTQFRDLVRVTYR